MANLCCAIPANRQEETNDQGQTYERCLVCKLRHFSINAEAGNPFAPPHVIGELTVKLNNKGVITLDIKNLKRDKAALLGVLDEAKTIVNRMETL